MKGKVTTFERGTEKKVRDGGVGVGRMRFRTREREGGFRMSLEGRGLALIFDVTQLDVFL